MFQTFGVAAQLVLLTTWLVLSSLASNKPTPTMLSFEKNYWKLITIFFLTYLHVAFLFRVKMPNKR